MQHDACNPKELVRGQGLRLRPTGWLGAAVKAGDRGRMMLLQPLKRMACAVCLCSESCADRVLFKFRSTKPQRSDATRPVLPANSPPCTAHTMHDSRLH